jgi:DNA-binding HxlR family transcriptional regulator
MSTNKAELKEVLIRRYSKAVDELLEENEGIEEFAALEEAVTRLAEKTLPETLATLQASKAFPP